MRELVAERGHAAFADVAAAVDDDAGQVVDQAGAVVADGGNGDKLLHGVGRECSGARLPRTRGLYLASSGGACVASRGRPSRGIRCSRAASRHWSRPCVATARSIWQAWDRLLDFHLAEGTAAVVVGGTTGESPALERSELAELIRRARQRLAGRIPLIAGSGTAGTAKSVGLSHAGRGGRGRWAARRHPVLQPAHTGRAVPAFHGHCRRGRRASHPLQRARPDGLRHAARDRCPLVPAPAHRRHEGGDRRPVERGFEVLRSAQPGFVLLSGDDATAAALMREGAWA